MFLFDNVSTVLLCLFDRKVTSKYGGKLPFEKKSLRPKKKERNEEIYENTRNFLRLPISYQ